MSDRPYLVQDARDFVIHVWTWASGYAGALIAASTTLQLMMPQIEDSVSPQTFKICKAVLAFLIVAREIKEAMRKQNSRHDDNFGPVPDTKGQTGP